MERVLQSNNNNPNHQVLNHKYVSNLVEPTEKVGVGQKEEIVEMLALSRAFKLCCSSSSGKLVRRAIWSVLHVLER